MCCDIPSLESNKYYCSSLYVVITEEAKYIDYCLSHNMSRFLFSLMNGKTKEPFKWGIIFFLGYSIVIHTGANAPTVFGT